MSVRCSWRIRTHSHDIDGGGRRAADSRRRPGHRRAVCSLARGPRDRPRRHGNRLPGGPRRRPIPKACRLKLIGAGMDTAELLSGRAPVPGDGLWQMPSNANLHFLLAEAYRRGDAKRTPGKKKSGPYVNCSKIFPRFCALSGGWISVHLCKLENENKIMTIKTSVKAGGGQPPLPAQKERIKMKRIVNGLSQLNRGRRAYAVFALCAATAIALPAQKTFTMLQSFDSTDGANPGAALVQATDGDLYGTASSQGANGGGTIFKVTLSGTLVTLYNFCSESGCTDGVLPEAALVQATSGDFYGTTNDGGLGYGTVFRITPGGTLTTLYRFCSQSGCRDGSNPFAGLVQTANGDFYGTARNGGANAVGMVFEITPSGALTTLYSFCSESGCADGANPVAALVQATNGNLYGTTLAGGGATNGGTVFEITPSGRLTTLYTFCSQAAARTAQTPSRGWSRPPMGTSTGQRTAAGPATLGRSSKSPQAAHSRRCTASTGPTAAPPELYWSRAPTGTSTGQRMVAGPTATGRFSRWLRAARWRRYTASAGMAAPARAAETQKRACCRPRMGRSTGPRILVGPTAMGRSSACLWALARS